MCGEGTQAEIGINPTTAPYTNQEGVQSSQGMQRGYRLTPSITRDTNWDPSLPRLLLEPPELPRQAMDALQQRSARGVRGTLALKGLLVGNAVNMTYIFRVSSPDPLKVCEKHRIVVKSFLMSLSFNTPQMFTAHFRKCSVFLQLMGYPLSFCLGLIIMLVGNEHQI